MIFTATLLLLLAFAAAEKPSHCRHPDELDESVAGELEAAHMTCQDEQDECERSRCQLELLHLLDDNGNIKPQAMADLFLPEEGYEETKEFFVETFNHCVETDEGGNVPGLPEGCNFLKPLACTIGNFLRECGL